jgi:hypothetical protein
MKLRVMKAKHKLEGFLAAKKMPVNHTVVPSLEAANVKAMRGQRISCITECGHDIFGKEKRNRDDSLVLPVTKQDPLFHRSKCDASAEARSLPCSSYDD